MLFFALNGSDELGRKIAKAGNFMLAAHEEREFEGGEHKTRPLVSVRNEHVYILHSLNGTGAASCNDKLVRLLFFIAACRENGAERITAIVPYLAYSRKDRQTKPRDPVTTRYVATLLEAAGTDMVITLDAHNIMAFQNAFRCRTLHLDTRKLFAAGIAKNIAGEPAIVVSPDAGGVKRAQLFREMLEALLEVQVDFGFLEKRRSAGIVSGSHFAGDVAGKSVYVIDDMIGSGGTVLRAASLCRERGASAVHALAAHGLFTSDARSMFVADALDTMTVTDSVAPIRRRWPEMRQKLTIVSVAPLISQAIGALEGERAVTDLLEFTPSDVAST